MSNEVEKMDILNLCNTIIDITRYITGLVYMYVQSSLSKKKLLIT